MALAQGQGAPIPSIGQYHIQTDQGPNRFFRFQTNTGQYRSEQRHVDGSVTGTYGWVDPNGVLRLFDYISDAGGYRIEQQRLFKVCFYKFTMLLGVDFKQEISTILTLENLSKK